MALIPRSQGRTVSRPTLQQHTPMTGLGSIGKAVDGVLEARKEEKEKKEKADFALQSSKIGADINIVDSDLTLKVQTGELPYEEAVKQRQQSLESIKTQYKTAVPKQFEQSFNNYFEQHSYQSASKYLPIAQKSEQQQAIVQLKDMRENYLKNPNASEKEVWNGLALYAQSKGLPLAHVQDTFNEYKNNRAGNDVATFYLGNKSDNEKLTELSTPEAVIAKHPNLTQEQAVYWSGRALTQIDQNNRAVALQQKQLEDDAKDAVNEMKADIETGLIPSEDVIKSRLARVKGTGEESEFAQYSGSLVKVQQFMRLGPDEREAYLSKRRAEAQNTAQDNPKYASWELNLLSKTHENMLNYEKNNASLAYSIKTGQDLTVVPTNAILSGSPEAIAAVSKNIKAIHANNILNGTIGSLNPFSQQQQSELKQFWENARPGDKLSLLTSLYKASAGNANASRDMINSIAGESGAYRLSASLNNRGLQDIAGQIITGQELLEKGLVKVDEAGLRNRAETYLKGVTSPGKPDFQIYLDAVKANYAYLIQKSDKVADSKGNLLNKTIDEDLFGRAILNVTGGKFTSGGIFGSKSVVLRPHTVSEKSFQEQLENFNSRNARYYGGSDKDFFLDLPLEQDPKNPYLYYFKNGTKYVMDSTDKTRQKRLTFTVR
ncbi:hypothetical protein FSC05_09230 [Acinetobacter indicus]|uniref:hypothetical protein n=1 Tax=Acinetobacter indicus TaxID=756892 RepID=UPI0013B09D2D|nr:hypothetical protein [Acinetobacter indicus]QIC73869.1 hypothetical protein FSC05_09230 [Acinetobacter indicus]